MTADHGRVEILNRERRPPAGLYCSTVVIRELIAWDHEEKDMFAELHGLYGVERGSEKGVRLRAFRRELVQRGLVEVRK